MNYKIAFWVVVAFFVAYIAAQVYQEMVEEAGIIPRKYGKDFPPLADPIPEIPHEIKVSFLPSEEFVSQTVDTLPMPDPPLDKAHEQENYVRPELYPPMAMPLPPAPNPPPQKYLKELEATKKDLENMTSRRFEETQVIENGVQLKDGAISQFQCAKCETRFFYEAENSGDGATKFAPAYCPNCGRKNGA